MGVEDVQDLIVYAMTPTGRVESTNYRTVMMPSGMDVPVFVKTEFGDFYKSTFEKAHQKENRRALLTEYAWNMSNCDPCSADPLRPEELRQLGVFWQGSQGDSGGRPVFLTRLHLRYDNEHFPEDLVFQPTADQQTYQARYVLRHAFKGGESCSAMESYLTQVDVRHQAEAKTLADLTGWDLSTIHRKMGGDAPRRETNAWYEQLWK